MKEKKAYNEDGTLKRYKLAIIHTDCTNIYYSDDKDLLVDAGNEIVSKFKKNIGEIVTFEIKDNK